MSLSAGHEASRCLSGFTVSFSAVCKLLPDVATFNAFLFLLPDGFAWENKQRSSSVDIMFGEREDDDADDDDVRHLSNRIYEVFQVSNEFLWSTDVRSRSIIRPSCFGPCLAAAI
jgi:hypothetical protein